MSVIEAYLAGPRDLRAAVDGLSREQLASRPVPGKWSILEVVCHLTNDPGPMIRCTSMAAPMTSPDGLSALANSVCML